ncbi:hypothetical protein BRC62_00215 [Halobacteriales archaeon QH_10_67_13]|nr:MAG: hypothetical protein BRC62_00215 [Halobacteriales archaeon QH_10_67_13]
MVHLPDFRSYTAWHHHANRTLYEAPADPWSQIRVDPTVPDQFTIVSLLWGLGRVRDGDWDRPENCSELTETRMYDGLYQHFVQGRDWEETAYHDWVTETIDSDGHFRGYKTVETVVEERYPAVDELYERIREDGYRANHGTVYDGLEGVEDRGISQTIPGTLCRHRRDSGVRAAQTRGVAVTPRSNRRRAEGKNK